jgi:predicted RNA-binding protein with PUA-like domain
MAYWLIKSEPGTWSWEAHVKQGADAWTGVRNHQAKAHLKAMKKGERAFFYHSGEGKEIVGVSEVVREAYADPTDKTGAFVCVEFKAVEPMKKPVTLAAIKAEQKLAAMVLVKNSRLSVQPVSAEEWKLVRKLAGMG